MHLRLAAQPLDVGLEVLLIGADGAAEGLIILKGRAEAEREDGGVAEAIGDDPGVVALRLLIHASNIFRKVLGDDDREIPCRKEKRLVVEESLYPLKRGWATVTTELRKRLALCDAVGIPCHSQSDLP